MPRLSPMKWVVVLGLAAGVGGVALTSFAQNKTPAPNAGTAKPAAPAANQPTPPAQQQQAPAQPAASAQPNAAQPARPSWIARCGSQSRQAPLECTIEQQVIQQASGQQISYINVRVPGDTRQPVMMIQLPLGLYLPAGLNLQVDEGKPQALPIQSCDQRACYVGLQISPELLEAMRKGQRLNLGVQSINREPIVIVHPLADFAGQYQKIQ